ncbi:MAG: SHOCT domain-containing protein [Gemmatimonadaceae bacterium]|nr:SHOCT domain-containing protein [Gemmatimonadaceae bacterium]
MNGLLVPGERLLAFAVQRRIFALTHRRTIVAATTGRFVALSRGLLGGYVPFDVRWQDLRDVQIRAGIFGATLTISALAHADLATREGSGVPHMFLGLRKLEAQQVYKICQSQEQAWREKRRVRDLDEMRAESGGVQLGGQLGALSSAAIPGGTSDPTARLRRAKEMLDDGLITDAEYESIKARVVDGL